jgi:hypothetical protein
MLRALWVLFLGKTNGETRSANATEITVRQQFVEAPITVQLAPIRGKTHGVTEFAKRMTRKKSTTTQLKDALWALINGLMVLVALFANGFSYARFLPMVFICAMALGILTDHRIILANDQSH